MAMRAQDEVQGDLAVTSAEMLRSPGRVLSSRLQKLLDEGIIGVKNWA
jgi:hypothetical protein